MDKKIIKLLSIIIISFILIVFNAFEIYNPFSNGIIALITLCLCIYNMIVSKNNIINFILHLQLFYYNYSIIFSRYLNIVNEFTEFYINTNDKVLGIGITCVCIFELIMAIFNKKDCTINDDNMYAEKNNPIIGIFLLGCLVYIFLFAFDWSGFGQRGATSTLYEYSGILFILGLFYLKDHPLKIIYKLLIIAMILQGIVYGERVASLQFIFILLFYFYKDKIKIKHILILTIIGIVLMSIVGEYRSNYYFNYLDISSYFKSINSRLLTFDGADLGYYCSLTFIMVANKVSNLIRLDMFGKFLSSIVTGANSNNVLPTYTYNYYQHWYGGYYPLYFYFYGGIPLVIISALGWCNYIYLCLNFKLKKHKRYFCISGLYIVCITARWYMYSPVNAFRPLLLFSILYFMFEMFNKLRKDNVIQQRKV